MSPRPFVLWFRASRRGRWESVGEAPTYGAAVALIGTGGRRNGDWLIRDNGRDPNRDVPPWSADRSASSGA